MMKVFSFIFTVLCSASLYALDYYGAGRVFEDNKKTHVRVKISTEGASKEEFAKNTKKKFKLVTSGGVIETRLLPANEKGEFLFEKEIPKNDSVLLAISTDKKITDVYIPKWKKLKESKSDEAILAELYKRKDQYKEHTQYIKGQFEAEILYEGSSKVSENGDWKILRVGFWDGETYQKYQKAKRKEEYQKVDFYLTELKKATALFYKNVMLNIFFHSRNGGSSYLRPIGAMSMGGRKYAIVLEKDYYASKDYDLFNYLYEFDENKQGKKILPLHPVGIGNDEDEGC